MDARVSLMKKLNKGRLTELVIMVMLIIFSAYNIITETQTEKFEDVITKYECAPYKQFSNKNTHEFWFDKRKNTVRNSIIFDCLEKSKVVGKLVKVEYQHPHIVRMTFEDKDLLSKRALKQNKTMTLYMFWTVIILCIVFAFIRAPAIFNRQ